MQEWFIQKDVWHIILPHCNIETLYALRSTCKVLRIMVHKKESKFMKWVVSSPKWKLKNYCQEWGSVALMQRVLRLNTVDLKLWRSSAFHLTKNDLCELFLYFLAWEDKSYLLCFLNYIAKFDWRNVMVAIQHPSRHVPDLIWKEVCKKINIQKVLQCTFQAGLSQNWKSLVKWTLRQGMHIDSDDVFCSYKNFTAFGFQGYDAFEFVLFQMNHCEFFKLHCHWETFQPWFQKLISTEHERRMSFF